MPVVLAIPVFPIKVHEGAELGVGAGVGVGVGVGIGLLEDELEPPPQPKHGMNKRAARNTKVIFFMS
jgi:hypothetical protein